MCARLGGEKSFVDFEKEASVRSRSSDRGVIKYACLHSHKKPVDGGLDIRELKRWDGCLAGC